ncbi:MAG: hypothetical protein ACOY0T_22730 [Myxococcota bacterium]
MTRCSSRIAASVASLTLVVAAPAAACPSCALATEVRTRFWADDFGYHLAVAALPFLLILAVCWRLERAAGRDEVREMRS